MKKSKLIIILIACLTLGLGAIAPAQTIGFTGSHYGNALDTLTNSETMYITSPILSAYRTGKVSIQLDCINKTGTTTITAVLQSSLDGTTWSNHFKVAGTNGIHCDTLSVSGTTQHIFDSYVFAKSTAGSETNAGRRLYFRLKLIGGATQSTQVKAKMVTSE